LQAFSEAIYHHAFTETSALGLRVLETDLLPRLQFSHSSATASSLSALFKGVRGIWLKEKWTYLTYLPENLIHPG
jgi:hypothetical protein